MILLFVPLLPHMYDNLKKFCIKLNFNFSPEKGGLRVNFGPKRFKCL